MFPPKKKDTEALVFGSKMTTTSRPFLGNTAKGKQTNYYCATRRPVRVRLLDQFYRQVGIHTVSSPNVVEQPTHRWATVCGRRGLDRRVRS